jgi:hypothetical protein
MLLFYFSTDTRNYLNPECGDFDLLCNLSKRLFIAVPKLLTPTDDPTFRSANLVEVLLS